jgi:NADPH:quinone reductase-like Zn-dependent oxidoreductase
MRAIVYSCYGSPDVLNCEDVEKSTAGGRAAAVNPLDWHCMRGTRYFMRIMAGLPKPKERRAYCGV